MTKKATKRYRAKTKMATWTRIGERLRTVDPTRFDRYAAAMREFVASHENVASGFARRIGGRVIWPERRDRRAA